MEYFGVILYGLLAVLCFMFWWKARGKSLDDLMAQNEHEHHHVHRVIAKHSLGGTWREHGLWMKEEEE